MQSTILTTLNTDPVGRTIISALSHLDDGNYALAPEENGKTKVLKLTHSHETDFYRFLCTINLPFEKIKQSNLLQNYPVELNASPAGSESQEYEMDALVFSVA